ncbi:hypothetical protein E1200_03365 [Actinomadura sp. GC306]|uniref:hypothetical protein n=1 Tax=Actinomadura sp. GC306 TaxID=2530367 RepID=UPI00104F6DC3|nr:hypothetical protein [Actinomadura sp. GC306]TDC71044.1 hypothetical protein E1200_03365 [Actinomadura sp. GC306]
MRTRYYVVHQFYCIDLPDTPYNLARSLELWDYINAEEGAKVEVYNNVISIEGAPRPPIPDSPRAKPRTLRQAMEEMRELQKAYCEQWENGNSEVTLEAEENE